MQSAELGRSRVTREHPECGFVNDVNVMASGRKKGTAAEDIWLRVREMDSRINLMWSAITYIEELLREGIGTGASVTNANTYSSSNRSSSTRECYIGYMHHTTSIQIPSPPPSVSSHTTMSSECFNQYCHPLVSNSPPYSTIASGVLPKTPPPLLTDPHRHHINNSSSSSCSHSMKVTLPSLHDIIAGTLPNASRRLPAPITAPSSSPIMNRMPNHHLLSSFPSHHQHPSL
ncbi:hypothetical protein BX666DRAFT_2031533 [Dichotomocladium elegans]|nr:hypothetical protein BX666DRAFT_2031533 [Dichotomocladium elegans]